MQKFARIVEHNDTQILVLKGYSVENYPSMQIQWRTTDGADMELWLKNTDDLTDEQEEEWMENTLSSDDIVSVAKSIANKVGGLNALDAAKALSED